MDSKNSQAEKILKILYRQLSGQLSDKDEIILPSIIKGRGNIWCWDPFNKSMMKVERGITIYILEENYDSYGRTLIYCTNADIMCIDPEEIEVIGLN
jgi:hypothetical protein